jgi:putative Mg2+ transporter-C (MgtC) family protein
MHDITLLDMIVRLIVSAVLGGLVGLERETHGRPAGLRTHILVCVGSALFALCSYSVAGSRFDPGRVMAQIVTGIGFLGAGTIMRQGSVVRGLTTAASIWTVSAIGIAVAIGSGMYVVAAAAAILVVVTLNLVPHLESWLLQGREERVISIIMRRKADVVCAVLGLATKHGGRIRVLGSEEGPEANTQNLRLRIRGAREIDESQFAADMAGIEDVISYSWE